MHGFTASFLLMTTEVIPRPLVLVEDGRIVEASPQASRSLPADCPLTDFGDSILAPGYIDLHMHGGGGFDVMDAEAEALPTVERLLARHGVTSYFPTTVTAPLDAMLRSLERLAAAVEASVSHPADAHGASAAVGRARPLGIHLEGPFLSHLKRGVHPPEELREPTLALFDRFWEAARGHIRLMTIAPELPGAEAVIAEATLRGVCVSLGHSDATAADAQRGIAAGGRHATHTFNAMRALDHREPGILGTVLTDPGMTADIIVDGVHVDPAVVRLFLQAKGEERAVLITDATAATGMADGTYRLGKLLMDLHDGVCWHQGKLAGSALTMDRAVRNVMQFAGWNLRQAVRLATANPARVAGMAVCNAKRDLLVPGAAADMVVLSPAGEVRQTLLGGVV